MKWPFGFLHSPGPKHTSPHKSLRVALIADELTRACMGFECRVWDLTPANYALVLRYWQPDFLFVESAWQGRRNSWKYKIASYPDRHERNNLVLRNVVSCARRLRIPTVFWNKEDGIHFERFISSASLFDIIFTVDANCIERYRERLGPGVIVEPLMFAAQPAIHHPSGTGYKYRRACFLGSYSHHIHELRRQRQDMLFSSASSEIGLTVFDRNSNRKSGNYRYPEMDGLDLRGRVAYDQTAAIYRDYMISLNVNTIEDSETMFSRRLVEIIASGGLAVTTPAKSVTRYFKDFCYIVSSNDEARELFRELRQGLRSRELDMVREGANHIHRNHTWSHRIETVLNAVSSFKTS